MIDLNSHKPIFSMTTDKQIFDQWCIVELFGHQKIAGHCTEQNIAGTNMLRVDVPETKSIPAFTKFYGSSAIYAINPVDEQTARLMVERLQARPIDAWDLSQVMKKYQEQTLIPETTKPEEPVRTVTYPQQEGDDVDNEDEHRLYSAPGLDY